MKESIANYVRESLTSFGRDVNTNRQLPSVYDGLKPSYRRLLYEELKSGGKLRKTVDVIGSLLSTCHSHGDASLVNPASNLVRWGLSKGQGNHGKKMLIGDDVPPSAMRYTEIAISDKWNKIFKDLLPYVPYKDAEVNGKEPEYLPSILPLCLVFGTQGLGLGVNCRIPAFTPESLLDAYFNDDPYLLRGNFGLEIDFDNSDIERLWNKGVGKITYKFKTYSGTVEGSWGYFLEGVPELIKPNLASIHKLVKSGKAYIIDMTDRKSTKIFVSREYNIRSIQPEDIKNAVVAASVCSKTYRLTVSDKDTVYLIPLKDWLHKSMLNYTQLIEKYKQTQINKIKFEIEVYTNLKSVAVILLGNPDTEPEEISKKLGLSIQVVKGILTKSLNTLRRSDSTKKIKGLEQELDKFNKLSPDSMINQMVDELKKDNS